jgi:hypothetical protein
MTLVTVVVTLTMTPATVMVTLTMTPATLVSTSVQAPHQTTVPHSLVPVQTQIPSAINQKEILGNKPCNLPKHIPQVSQLLNLSLHKSYQPDKISHRFPYFST